MWFPKEIIPGFTAALDFTRDLDDVPHEQNTLATGSKAPCCFPTSGILPCPHPRCVVTAHLILNRRNACHNTSRLSVLVLNDPTVNALHYLLSPLRL